jgi:hypothetical protein
MFPERKLRERVVAKERERFAISWRRELFRGRVWYSQYERDTEECRDLHVLVTGYGTHFRKCSATKHISVWSSKCKFAGSGIPRERGYELALFLDCEYWKLHADNASCLRTDCVMSVEETRQWQRWIRNLQRKQEALECIQEHLGIPLSGLVFEFCLSTPDDPRLCE